MPKDEFDFNDPMELNGVGLACAEDTTEAMTECFIEEFMRLGHNPKQILALFRNPHYIGMNMVVQNRGEQFVRDRITQIFARWGRAVTWPDSGGRPLTPENPRSLDCVSGVGENSSDGQVSLSPQRGEARVRGENANDRPDLSRQIIEHDLTATDPTGAPVPIIKP